MTHKKAMAILMEDIKKAQTAYHITGENFKNEYQVSYTGKGGQTVTYKAKRNWTVRGLSYTITREDISIARGYIVDIIAHTNEWAR